MDPKPKVPIGCFFRGCYNEELEVEIKKAKDLCYRYNGLHPNDREGQQEILKELLGKMGDQTTVMPPFWCDYGYHITIGDFFMPITI